LYKLEYKYSNNDDLQCMPNTHVLSLTPRFSFVKVFIGGAVTFTLGPRRCILRRIPDKNYRCIFTRGSRGEVMILYTVKIQTTLNERDNSKFNVV
jgi:hypothetical protein